MSTKANSLGIDKPPADTRVVVAMSGGVDSSVAAALLHEEGYDVIGVTLQLYDHGEATAKSKTCCAGQDIHDAKRVAENCGFPHYVLDYESKFKEAVIDDFADSYIRGETPIPCVRCNQTVKFNDLLEVAKDLSADCMATGHYIKRTVDEQGKSHLHRAHDEGKDQSYFLFTTTAEQLDFLRFPLGAQSKAETRKQAKRLDLLTADKPDSQDICFVPDGDYAKVVRKIRPEAEKPGEIIHEDGRVLGQHKGIIHYTIGQRKGIGIGGGIDKDNNPFYVIHIDPQTNQVIVGAKESLARNILFANECNWLEDEIPLGGREITLKFRSTMKPVPARIFRDNSINSNATRIELASPQYGISAGQAAVFYDEDRVLGGGWITSTQNTT